MGVSPYNRGGGKETLFPALHVQRTRKRESKKNASMIRIRGKKKGNVPRQLTQRLVKSRGNWKKRVGTSRRVEKRKTSPPKISTAAYGKENEFAPSLGRKGGGVTIRNSYGRDRHVQEGGANNVLVRRGGGIIDDY